MVEKYGVWNDYWEDKKPKLRNITVPMYATASFSTGLHTEGSLRGFQLSRSSEKWYDTDPSFHWKDERSNASLGYAGQQLRNGTTSINRRISTTCSGSSIGICSTKITAGRARPGLDTRYWAIIAQAWSISQLPRIRQGSSSTKLSILMRPIQPWSSAPLRLRAWSSIKRTILPMRDAHSFISSKSIRNYVASRRPRCICQRSIMTTWYVRRLLPTRTCYRKSHFLSMLYRMSTSFCENLTKAAKRCGIRTFR